jgi:Family of unknown function (DUF6311)
VSRFDTLRARVRARISEAVIPVLLGALAFFGVTGGRLLSPRNIAWLSEGDAAQYFLGWHFFRLAPWGFPLGSSPYFGAELSSSIFYADGLALFAIPFKALSRFLPATFQYTGIWLLCCFVLQAWFAWLLLGLLTRARLARACGMLLFVFAPPFLGRVGGHYQLAGQWLVLAALYLCLARRELARGYAWPLLAFTVGLVHSYLTAMVLGLWLTDWLRRVFFDGRTRADLLQLITVPGAVVLALWQAGMFMLEHGALKAGFGEYRMNVLSVVNASGWSYLLPPIPQDRGDYEGFNYLGLGVLLLALSVLPSVRYALLGLRKRRRYWPLFALLLGFTLFALSNRVGFARHTFEIPLSKSLIDYADILRSSGRMFWPAFYLLCWVLLRALFRRYPPRVAAALLFVAALAQTVDTSAGWRTQRAQQMVSGTTWASPLRSPFWADVPANYDQIRMVPPRNIERNWQVFAYFAAMHGMTSDAVYLARIDKQKAASAKRQAELAVNKAQYLPRTLYILDRHYQAAARRSANGSTLVAEVDGFLVLAPGWKCRPQCSAVGAQECAETCPKR